MKTISPERQKQLEKLLRRLRAIVFNYEDNPKKDDQIQRLIKIAKARMMPIWEERQRQLAEIRLERWFAIQ